MAPKEGSLENRFGPQDHGRCQGIGNEGIRKNAKRNLLCQQLNCQNFAKNQEEPEKSAIEQFTAIHCSL